MIKRGIEPERLTFIGYGFNKPIASNDTAEGRSLNRRTEFKIVSNSAPAEQPAPATETEAPVEQKTEISAPEAASGQQETARESSEEEAGHRQKGREEGGRRKRVHERGEMQNEGRDLPSQTPSQGQGGQGREPQQGGEGQQAQDVENGKGESRNGCRDHVGRRSYFGALI